LYELRKRKEKVVFVAHDEQHNVKEERKSGWWLICLEIELSVVHHIMLKESFS